VFTIQFRRVLSAIAILAAVTVGLAIPASPAGATGPCGSSYAHVGHWAVGNDITDEVNMYLDTYWSTTTKRNCLVVAHAGSTYGVAMYTLAKIRPSGWSWPGCPSVGCDVSSSYKYYAGPVYTPSGVDMTHRCIDIAGQVGTQTSRIIYGVNCG
jgi:hypothetical protein